MFITNFILNGTGVGRILFVGSYGVLQFTACSSPSFNPDVVHLSKVYTDINGLGFEPLTWESTFPESILKLLLTSLRSLLTNHYKISRETNHMNDFRSSESSPSNNNDMKVEMKWRKMMWHKREREESSYPMKINRLDEYRSRSNPFTNISKEGR